MIGVLCDQDHEQLWRICDALVTGAGARAAVVCDAASGAVLLCVGDATGRGAVLGVEPLGPGEQAVHGDGGEIYGVDIPGGALLAVLHDGEAVERIRSAAATAVAEAADLIARLPPHPPPLPPVHSHGGELAPARKPRPAAKKKKAAPLKKRPPQAKRAPAVKSGARKKKKTGRRG